MGLSDFSGSGGSNFTYGAALPSGNNFGSSGGAASSNTAPTNPWSIAGTAADIASSLLPVKSEYSGDKGSITATMDLAYDGIANAVSNVPPWGTVLGGAMKGLGAIGKGLNAIGLGTDGMTTQDAILGSSFFNWNVGLINGIGAEKAETMSLDKETWARGGMSYQGSESDFNTAMTKQGKKYGLFSKKGLREANELIADNGRTLNRLKTMMNENAMSKEALGNLADMQNMAYTNLVTGGYNLSAVRAAKHGGLLFTQDDIRRAKGISFSINFGNQQNTQNVEFFQNGGLMTVIPEGALHAHKHNLEKEREDLKGEITHKGIPVIDNNGVQQAEIERDEVILSLEITLAVEELRTKYNESDSQKEKDELAIEAGKLLVEEFQTNLDDRTGLFKQIKA